MIEGVIFDMDGVIVMSLPFTTEAAVRMFAEHGVTVRPEEFLPFLGQGEAHLIQGVAESRGVAIDPEQAKARVYEIYFELIPGRLKAVKGAIEFIQECRDRGLKLAIASSGDADKVKASLTAIHLPESTFDKVVNGSQIAEKKPSPALFLEAARELGLDPSHCLVVEDAEAGVEAARAAGSKCLAVLTTTPAEKLAKADWIARDLSEVPNGVLGW